MKVVQVSTGSIGGAGLAALRYHQLLRSYGVDSDFICLAQNKLALNAENGELVVNRAFRDKIISKLLTSLNLIFSRKVFFSLWSAPSVSFEYFAERYEAKNTILHFHNTYNFIGLKDIERLAELGFGIVLSQHDQRLLTGGCHYSLDCTNLIKGCKSCPKIPKVLHGIPSRNKVEGDNFASSTAARKIVVTAPSSWLADQFSTNSGHSFKRVVLLPNALSIHQHAFKGRLLKSDELVVGIAAMYPFSYLKGGDVLRNVIKLAKAERMSIQFAFLQDFPQTEQGKTEFWSSIDVLLHLSRADNRPNVIEEAHVNGVPVCGSNVGGVQESLIEGVDCLLNSLDVMHILDNLVNNKWVRFSHVNSLNQNQRIFEDLLALYSEITSTT